SSGRVRAAGASEDQADEPPPSESKANPPVQTGPAPAGSPSGCAATVSPSSRLHSAATSAKRLSPRETAWWATPSAAIAKPRSGCSQQNQLSDASREANTVEQGSRPSARTVALTSERRPRIEARSSPSRIPLSRGSVAASSNRDLARADHLDQPVG